MQRKSRMAAFGALSLTAFSAFLAFNQIIIKLVNEGLQPDFFAGVRSLLAIFCLWGWLVWRGRPPRLERRYLGVGLIVGAAFAAEFLFLFMALDLTTVTRTSIILYSMPLWLAFAAHFVLPGERTGPVKALGLALAFAGVVCFCVHVLSDRGCDAVVRVRQCGRRASFGWDWVGLRCLPARRRIHREPKLRSGLILLCSELNKFNLLIWA